MYVLSINIKNIKICPMKFLIFTSEKNLYILHRQVFVMKQCYSYFCQQELEALQLGKDWVANLTVKKHGRLDALAVWFDLHLDECVTIATGPDTENCWEQAVYPVQTVQREKDTGENLT